MHISLLIFHHRCHITEISVSVCVKGTKHQSFKTFSLPYAGYSNDGKQCEREKLLLWFESICSYRVEVPDLQGFVIGCRNQKVGVRGPGHIRYTLRVCQRSLEMHVKMKPIVHANNIRHIMNKACTHKFMPGDSFLKLAIIGPPDFDQFVSSCKQQKKKRKTTVNNDIIQRFN